MKQETPSCSTEDKLTCIPGFYSSFYMSFITIFLARELNKQTQLRAGITGYIKHLDILTPYGTHALNTPDQVSSTSSSLVGIYSNNLKRDLPINPSDWQKDRGTGV